MNVSPSDYIRWVKGSLNRLLGCNLPDNGAITIEYRTWVLVYQINESLAITGNVDSATQNSMIKRNRGHRDYVRWIQTTLNKSGEGIGPGGKGLAVDGFWGSQTEGVVKDFQINREDKLKPDGYVGAQTETLLYNRSGEIPSGRPGAKYGPTPLIWGGTLSGQLQVEKFAKVFADELAMSYLNPRKRQMQCLASKLKTLDSGDANFGFFSLVDVDHFFQITVPKQGSQTVEQFITGVPKSNAKRELLEATALASSSPAAAYLEFKKAVEKIYGRIQDGMQRIQYKYATDPATVHNLQATMLHQWSNAKQQQASHVYSCFKLIDT